MVGADAGAGSGDVGTASRRRPPRLPRPLTAETRIGTARTVFLLVLVYSILRGIRFPNIWSYSHFLFNYDHGFTKRGLIGAIVQASGQPYLQTYDFFFFFSLAVLVLNMALLAHLVSDFIQWGGRLAVVCSLIFASSMAIVFLAHTVGYFDHLGLLTTLLVLRIPGFYKKALFLSVLLPPLLLVHEAMLVVFFPVMFLALLFSLPPAPAARELGLLIAVTALALATAYVTTGSPLPPTQVEEMYQAAQSANELPLRRDAYAVLERSAEASAEYMSARWGMEAVRSELKASLWRTAPSFVTFVCFTVLVLGAAGTRFALRLCAALASLSPLLLHTIAADMHRWNTLTITTSFLILYLACRVAADTVDLQSYDGPALLVAPLILVNANSSIELFDGFTVKTPPFGEHIEYLKRWANGAARFPQAPPR